MRTSDQISTGLQRAADRAWESLTPREKEVCKASIGGKSIVAIAVEMAIKPNSVKHLKKLVRRKIGWRSDIYFDK